MSAKNLQRIFSENAFNRLVYVTAGYPEPSATPDILLAIQEAGNVEAVELGVPFTDPVGDGPVIAECSKIAMEKGTTNINQALAMLKEARDRGFTLPCLLMGYANTFKEGWSSKATGLVDGVIVVDLPYEEPYTHSFIEDCKEKDISFIPILTPLTSRDRIQTISDTMSSSFMYCTTVTGVTGARDFLKKYFEGEYGEIYRGFKQMTSTPCIVGFGVSSAEAVGMVKDVLKADGVVVGSAFMKILKEEAVEARREHIVAFLKELFA